MLTLKNTSVMNFENAIRGARNPMNSWGRMDSHTEPDGSFVFGPNDLDLAMRLAKAGSDHRKYLRMVFVSVDVTAPLYWWKEYDTYKVATVANSTSTMHKIHSKPFSMDDFSCDHMTDGTKKFMETEDYSLSIFAFCNMGIVYGMLAFVFYMFSFIVSSKENIDFLHQQCLIDYISEGLFFLIAGAIKIVSKWRMKYKSTKLKCSNCIHKKVCSITNDENDIKSCKNFIDKSSLREVSND